MMRDPRFWLRSWSGADRGCKRKLLPSKAGSELHSASVLKTVDPIAHALYKTWAIERYGLGADVYLRSYKQMAALSKDTAPLWKRVAY